MTNRRQFLTKAGTLSVGAAGSVLAAPAIVKAQTAIKWRFQTYAGSVLGQHVTKPIIDMILRNTPEQHEKQIRALVERPDARPVLPNIKCPTLVLCGAQDEWSTPEQHRDMAAQILGAELQIIAVK